MNKKRIDGVIDGALTTQIFSHIVLMIGTAFAVNQAIFKMVIEKGIEYQTASIGAAVAGIFAAIIVDGSLKKWLPYTVACIVGKKDKDTGTERLWWFNWLVGALTVVMLGVSTYTNVALSPDISAAVNGEADVSQYEHTASSALSRYESDLARIEQDIEDAKQSLDQKIADKSEAILSAQKSKGAKMYELVKAGNGWAINNVAAAVRRATRKADKAIASAEQTLQEQKGRRAAYMATSGSNLDTVQLTTANLITSTTEKHEAKTSRWTGILFIFMVAAFFAFVVSTIIVVTFEENEGVDLERRATFGNISKGVAVKAKTGLLSGLVKLFGLNKFTPAPALALPGHYAHTLPPSLTQQKSRSQNGNQKTRNSDTGKSQESECKDGKCPPKSEERNSDNTETRNSVTEKPTQNAHTEQKAEQMPEVGENGWPTPNNPEWLNLCKKARGWSRQIIEADKQKTRDKNRERFAQFVQHCEQYGYRAGRSEDTGTCFINQDSEAVEVMDGTFEWDLEKAA